MSWLKGIAGKAEDFLNRVDQTAAQALQKNSYPSDIGRESLLLSEQHVSSWSPSNISGNSSTPSTGTFHSVNSPVYSSTAKLSQTSSSKKQSQKKKEDDDEKLLEFLNSDETITPSPKKSLSRKGSQVSSSSTQLNMQENIEASGTSSSKEITEVTSNNEGEKTEEIFDEKGPPTEVTPSLKGDKSGELVYDKQVSEEYLQSSSFPVTQPSDEQQAVTPLLSTKQTSTSTDPGNSRLMQLENENTLLQKEIVSLNQEMSLVIKRAKNNEAEMSRMQRKLDHWTSQISGSDHLIRELQAREIDLTNALSAKDSQLAVLRVRLQEADQELEVKRKLVDELRLENERIMKDQNDASGLHNQTLESMREKLQEVEMLLKREQESYRTAQAEYMQRMSKLEEEQQHLVESLTSAQKQVVEEKSKTRDLTAQLKISKGNLDAVRQELADYKQKAQRILQSKEKLIVSLKDSDRVKLHEDQDGALAQSVIAAELEDLKQERDSLREELQRATVTIDTLHSDIQEMEQMSHNEADTAQEHQKVLEEQLKQERQCKTDFEQECMQLKEEMKFLHEDFMRTKVNLEARIQDRDADIDKLRKQITAKNMSTTTQAELEARLCALTENLIQKQTLVEALSTEKNSLVLQLERMEQQMKELQLYGSRKQTTVVGMSNVDIDGRIKPSFIESPYDGSVTRKMKRVYGTIDAFSIRLGIFLRRYPVARVFIIVYMLLLHLWVMVVLLTYQPEVHGPNYADKGTKL